MKKEARQRGEYIV
jgi:hypothetical protein